MQILFSILVYALALVVTFLVIVFLPPALIGYMLEHRRTGGNRVRILVLALIAAAYLIGGVAGWLLRPPQWTMSFAQTFEAALNAEKYGHELEHTAERVLMYPLYMAALCSIAVLAGAGVVLKLRGAARGLARSA